MFKHNFSNVPSPFCSCGEASESILHFLRFCPLRVSQKRILYRNILLDTKINLLLDPESDFVRLLLYGDPKFNDSINDKLLKHCSAFIEATERFDIFQPLYSPKRDLCILLVFMELLRLCASYFLSCEYFLFSLCFEALQGWKCPPGGSIVCIPPLSVTL